MGLFKVRIRELAQEKGWTLKEVSVRIAYKNFFEGKGFPKFKNRSKFNSVNPATDRAERMAEKL